MLQEENIGMRLKRHGGRRLNLSNNKQWIRLILGNNIGRLEMLK